MLSFKHFLLTVPLLFALFAFLTLALATDHPHPGCPTNSSCSIKMGQQFQKWEEGLKKREKKVPQKKVPVWSWILPKSHRALSEDGQKNPETILWDSACSKHRRHYSQENALPFIVTGLNFTSDLSTLPKETDSYYRIFAKALTLSEDGQLITYQLPSFEIPLKLKGDQIIYLLDHQGQYYSLALDRSGKITQLSAQKTTHFSRRIECPAKLKAAFLDFSFPENLYQNVICRKLWNSQSDQFETFLFGWSCE